MTMPAVIFDMDGVLVDTEPIYIGINREIFADLGVDIPMDRHLGYVGISAQRMWGEIKRDFNLPHAVTELIANEKKAQMRVIREKQTLDAMAGVEHLLREFQRRSIPCAVASSSSRNLIDTVLEKSGLRAYFAGVTSGEDVDNGKPAPDIFLAAANSLKTEPAACLVIEDSPHGIEGAKTAGMKTCGFANPNSGRQDLSMADFVIDDFSSTNVTLVLDAIWRMPNKADARDGL